MPLHAARPQIASVLAASVVIALGVTAPARADVLDITSEGAAYGYDVAELHDSLFTFPENGLHAIAVYSGADKLAGTDLTTSKAFSAAVVFCTDVQNYLQNPSYTFKVGALSDTVTNATKATQIEALVSNGSQLLASNHDTVNGHTYTATQISSALQIAVWTAEYQTGTTAYNDGNSSRGFWTTPYPGYNIAADLTLANVFLGYVDTSSPAWTTSGSFVQLEPLNPVNNQDLTYFVGGTLAGNPNLPVVEPAALSLLGLGVAGLLAARRRRAA